MNRILKSALVVGILAAIFVAGYSVPFIKVATTPTKIIDLSPLPRGTESTIKDGILYTTVAVVPLVCITKITVENASIPYVIIEYKLSQTRSGMLAISLMEYRRLFGDPYAKI